MSSSKQFLHSLSLPVLLPESRELWVVLVEILVQGFCVLRVGDVPVDGGKVFSLSQSFVQTPEHLHYSQSGCRHRVRKVTTRGRHTETQQPKVPAKVTPVELPYIFCKKLSDFTSLSRSWKTMH